MASAPLFTPEQVKQDGQSRVAKTAGQAGVSGAVVALLLWVAHQAGWHGDMPPETVAAATTVLAAAAAWFTNRSKLRGEGGQSLIGVLVAVILIIVVLKLLGVW